MTSLEILVAARALLAEPYAWGKNRFVSYNKRGNRDCYCLIGALQEVAWGKNPFVRNKNALSGYRAALDSLIRQAACANRAGLVYFNDAPTTRKKDVLALLDRTIEEVSNCCLT